MFSLIATAVVAALPVEYVVDCSGWTGNREAEISWRYQCRDGTVSTGSASCPLRSTAPQLAVAVSIYVRREGWRFEWLNDKVFVVRGSKTSPIKSVTFNGDGWVPAVTRRLTTQPPPQPPKK